MTNQTEVHHVKVTPKYSIPGFKTLLMGDAGTGKTHALRTLIEAGLEVFAIFTEPGMEVVADIPSDKLHWNYISPSTVSWEKMIDSAKKINTMTFKMLTELPHINKGEHAEFMELLVAMSDYTDIRTGKKYGPVDNLDQSQVLWIDSLSGINNMAMNLVAGSKPMKSPADYGVAMDNLENFIEKLCNDLKCHVVVVGHTEKETNELTGGISTMVSTIGRKLAPKIPKLFSDVIHAQRQETKFYWSTTSPNTVLKARNLPWADNMPPSFVSLVKSWSAKNEAAGI
jgi:hypothetical protein